MNAAKQSNRNSSRICPLGFSAALALSLLALVVPYLAIAQEQKKSRKSNQGLPAMSLGEDEAIVHALNRLGYGPRPDDIQRVKQMGLAVWIDRQLHPESISDAALDARLEKFPTLKMSSAQLLTEFPQPRVAARREGMTVEEFRKQQQEQLRELRRQGAGAQPNAMPGVGDASSDPPGMAPPGPPGNAGGFGNAMMMNYEQVRNPQRVVAELSMAKVDRAIYTERQLYEQMVDFWFNHFNVFAGKGADKWLITSYERDAIRPNALGKFRDLLGATAHSPAMLFYLDNWQSADPEAAARMQQLIQQRRARIGALGPLGRQRRFPLPNRNPNPNANPQQVPPKLQARGLNENYGRELMELHTLGVDAGYTQQDVVAVARAFTGWTIRQPQRDPEFWFNASIHDSKPKVVLGRTINSGGMKDGEAVLDLLARDPHTAQHISREIARRFVSDAPSEALVNRMAQTFMSTDGDIRAVLHTMIYSAEFWSDEAVRAKIKTPFELVVSAARAVGADVGVPLDLVQWTNRIGQPLYMCQPPTGYSDKSEDWVNTGALLNRLNYALALGSNRLRGARTDTAALLGANANTQTDSSVTLDRAIAVLLSGQASPETRRILEKQMSDPQVLQASLDDPVREINTGVIAGLVLGSPEFQRR